MLHTKFRENRPAGSGEEDFERFLPDMGVWTTDRPMSRDDLDLN